MDDEELAALERWIELTNARGIAGIGARETEEDKLIVETRTLEEFAESIYQTNNISMGDIVSRRPPLPDLSCVIGGKRIHVELTEFIDEAIIQQAKYIKSNPEHPLYGEGLWFDTSYEWFSSLLLKAIEKKERRYANRDVKIDVLLIWNEATQLSLENTDKWLSKFEVPELENINSIYFQSWYHPSYLGRPIWSLKAHKEIGPIIPVKKPTET